jgi:hypothetical protein
MIEQICDELKIAALADNSSNIIDIIDRALVLAFPTRKELVNGFLSDNGYNEKWKVTNTDILHALKVLNRTR